MDEGRRGDRGGNEPEGERITLDQLREIARQILDQVRGLPDDVAVALRGLLEPDLSDEQIERGMAAVNAVLAAAADARQQGSAGGSGGSGGSGGDDEDDDDSADDEEFLTLLPAPLREWYTTPNWPTSREWLAAHLDRLPTNTFQLFQVIAARARGSRKRRLATNLDGHAALYAQARRESVDAAYRALIGDRAFEEGGASEGDGSNDELAALLNEFFTLERLAADPAMQAAPARRRANLTRQAILGQEILRRDEGRRLTHEGRYAVLGTLGNAFQALAGFAGGRERPQLFAQALACFEAAANERPREGAPLEWAAAKASSGNALRNLAGTQGGAARQHSLRQAVAAYELALLEYRRDVAPSQWAATHNNRGNALRNLAGTQGGAARQHSLRQAVAAYELSALERPLDVLPVDHRNAMRAIAAGRLTRAVALPDDEAVAELEWAWQAAERGLEATRRLELTAPSREFRQAEWVESARLFSLAAAIQAQRGKIDDAILKLEQGRARGLAEVQGRRGADLSALSDEQRAAYDAVLEEVRALEAEAALTGDSLALLPRLRAAYARLDRAGGSLLPRPVTVERLAGALREGEVYLYLVPLQMGTLLLALPKIGQPRAKMLRDFTSDDIFELAVQREDPRRPGQPQSPDETELLGRYRLGFLPAAAGWGPTKLDRALDALLPALGEKLMREVVILAHAAGAQRAIIIPGGMLAVLPLHAASYPPLDPSQPPTAPGSRRYACDDLRISYAPSAAALVAARETAVRLDAPRRGLVAANPQLTAPGQPWEPPIPGVPGSGSPGYLPYAQHDAERVAAIMERHHMSAETLVGAEVVWSALHDELQHCDVALLSMHASFNIESPGDSGLRLAHGTRLLLRVLLDERHFNLTRLRLAILSACQTAQSDFQRLSEETVGLLGGFLYAGAAGVLGTLWPVYDISASLLVEPFTERYLTDPTDAVAALSAVQADLRTRGDQLLAEMGGRRRGAPAEAVGTDSLVAAEQSSPFEHPIHWAAFVYYGA